MHLSYKLSYCTEQTSMTYVLTMFICKLFLENSSSATVEYLLHLDAEIYMFFKLGIK